MPLRPDYEQAEEIRAYLKANTGGYPTELVDRGRAISPGLAALVEKGERAHYPDFQTDWKYAASLIGEIGDRRAIPFFLKRLNDPDAMDWYFVRPLGQLKVKHAVPRLVEELRRLSPHGWEVNSNAYGSEATYLVEALEQITGQKFPKDQHSMVTDREATLKAVNTWWEQEDKRAYSVPATAPAGMETGREMPARKPLYTVSEERAYELAYKSLAEKLGINPPDRTTLKYWTSTLKWDYAGGSDLRLVWIVSGDFAPAGGGNHGAATIDANSGKVLQVSTGRHLR